MVKVELVFAPLEDPWQKRYLVYLPQAKINVAVVTRHEDGTWLVRPTGVSMIPFFGSFDSFKDLSRNIEKAANYALARYAVNQLTGKEVF